MPRNHGQLPATQCARCEWPLAAHWLWLRRRQGGPSGKQRTIIKHNEAAEGWDESPPENDKLPSTGVIEADPLAGRFHATGFIRLNTATAEVYGQQVMAECAVAQRLGIRKLYSDVSVAVERGNFKKLRLYR